MNQPLEEGRAFETCNQIRVHFHVCPPRPCQEIQGVLDRLAFLPGCVSYVLTYWEQNAFQWSIAGVWTNEEDRYRHYCSDQIQALFNCLLQQNASLICCSEGEILHPESEKI